MTPAEWLRAQSKYPEKDWERMLRIADTIDAAREAIEELIPYARATIGLPEPSWNPDNVILKARAVLAKLDGKQ